MQRLACVWLRDLRADQCQGAASTSSFGSEFQLRVQGLWAQGSAVEVPYLICIDKKLRAPEQGV